MSFKEKKGDVWVLLRGDLLFSFETAEIVSFFQFENVSYLHLETAEIVSFFHFEPAENVSYLHLETAESVSFFILFSGK